MTLRKLIIQAYQLPKLKAFNIIKGLSGVDESMISLKIVEVPSLTSCQIWHLWLFGDCNKVNIPYRMLKGDYMPQTQILQLSRARIVMETIRERIGMTFSEITALG
jgi:hypothetical protein